VHRRNDKYEKARRHVVKTTKEHVTIPNTLGRRLNVSQSNHARCDDVTYIWAGSRRSYLAVVPDLIARRPAGWAISRSPDNAIAETALTMTYESGGRPKKLMPHSDQRCPHTSLRELIGRYGIDQSISRRRNCWDNAPKERLFRSLKCEWGPESGYSSLEHVKRSIVNDIIGYYCQTKRHTFSDGLSPNAFERQHAKNANSVTKIT
jgi:putative transposase